MRLVTGWPLAVEVKCCSGQTGEPGQCRERSFLTGDRGFQSHSLRPESLVRALHATVILPGCGHWTQQERPAEVSAAMIDFIQCLDWNPAA
jgi:hypothetical protein